MGNYIIVPFRQAHGVFQSANRLNSNVTLTYRVNYSLVHANITVFVIHLHHKQRIKYSDAHSG